MSAADVSVDTADSSVEVSEAFSEVSLTDEEAVLAAEEVLLSELLLQAQSARAREQIAAAIMIFFILFILSLIVDMVFKIVYPLIAARIGEMESHCACVAAVVIYKIAVSVLNGGGNIKVMIAFFSADCFKS